MSAAAKKKFLEDINKFVNTEYKRGAIDKFRTKVTVTKKSLAQGFKEGYQDLQGKKSDYVQITDAEFEEIAAKAIDKVESQWSSKEGTTGHTVKYVPGNLLVWSAYRDIKRPYTIIKDESVKELNKLLKAKGSSALKGAVRKEGEKGFEVTPRQSEVGIFKSGTHRGHQGVTTVGSAQLQAAMRFITRTKAMSGFAESEEAKELREVLQKIDLILETSGTKKSGGSVSIKEDLFIHIKLEARSKNKAGAQKFDYTNLRKGLESAVVSYIENPKNNVAGLAGSKSIEENAVDAAAKTVVDQLTKPANVKVVSKGYNYKGRKKSKTSVSKNNGAISHKVSTKKASKPSRKTTGTAPMNISMLMGMLNQRLPDAVAANMNSPRLNYQTGRFAESVKVTDIIRTPQGYPSIGYTYQKNPYQTFEPGFAQGSVDRDPRKLIDRSIRDIAVEFAIGRFYTRRV